MTTTLLRRCLLSPLIRTTRRPRAFTLSEIAFAPPMMSTGSQAPIANMSARELRIYSRPSQTMQRFHSAFAEEFKELYELADGGFASMGWSLRSFLRMASQFVYHLNTHHGIEEQMVFPMLAAKGMTAFQEDAAHIESHNKIHQGLDRLTALVNGWKVNESSYSPAQLRECLDSFKEVLFMHLDQEVRDLAPEEFRKYFTAEEMHAMPF